MKWVALVVALLVVVPALAAYARRSQQVRGWLATVIAFEIFNPADLNIISEENYRGDSRGIEVTTVDLLTLSLFFGGVKARFTALLVPRLIYLAAVLASFEGSPSWLRSSYSVWKLLRMYFFFAVMAGALREGAVLRGALRGLSLAVLSQGLQSLYQKYALHAVRVVGSQAHPNSLAMLVNFVSPMALSLLLAGAGDRTAGLVVMIAAMCNIFSLSRGGMMMFLLASMMTVAGSIARRPTARKGAIVATMLVGGLVALAKSAETIIKRFTEAPKESELARKLFNKAAKMMADEHPFGVGINMYSFTLDHGGYADRLGIEPGDRNGIAHHIYWLTTAELGYGGVFAYGLLLSAVLLQAVRAARLDGVRGDIGLGVVAGLVVTYTQGTAEWIARQTNMSYLFWMMAALSVSLIDSSRKRTAT